jgi:hypothetical protein
MLPGPLPDEAGVPAGHRRILRMPAWHAENGIMMARVQPETVDKLIELLTLPIGENEDDERPQHLENDIQRVSQEFGWLVFEDDKWIEYDPSRIEDILQAWLDEETATRLDAAARESHARFLEWLENLVTGWKSQESGTQGPATEGGTFGPLGIANPYFEPDRVPGTEFYRYRDNEYVYAATADAPDGGWRTLEARVDEHRATAPADGLLRGHPHTNSALPGTAYYRVAGETYLYGPEEFGAAADWRPYEHWQTEAHKAQGTDELISATATTPTDVSPTETGHAGVAPEQPAKGLAEVSDDIVRELALPVLRELTKNRPDLVARHSTDELLARLGQVIAHRLAGR